MRNTKKIAVGIIGSGFAAQFHYEALRRVIHADLNIVGVYSKSVEELRKYAQVRELNVFDSLDKLIEMSDILHLCTPPSSHEPLAVKILQHGKHVVIEKPFTGYFGDGTESFNGDTFSRKKGLNAALESINRMLEAEKQSDGNIFYAENWVYAPAIRKEKEVIEKTKAQILWIQGQQSHSGSHSADYGKWHLSGGGSLMGKGCHPLCAAIYLKHVEGRARTGNPIRPKSVSCRTHAITRMPSFINDGFLRASYTDVEDYASLHLVFEDNTIADIVASELLHGGVKNYIEVHATNHRTICNIAPNNAMQLYNPVEDNLKDVYVVEKIGTKQGWSSISPDEGWFNGYQHEMDAFYNALANGLLIESNSLLAADVISSIYTAYLSASQAGIELPIDVKYV